MDLALAQLDVEAGAVGANVDRAVAAVEEAAGEGADLVVLPELFDVGYFAFDAYPRAAQSLTGDTLAAVRGAAADAGVAVLAGSVVEDLAATRAETDVPTPEPEGLANTAVLFDADGERRAVYRKHHLFGYDSAERRLLAPGESLERATADLGGFTVGVTTCYDLRFPELYRDLLDRGTTMVLVPSAWPYPRVEHWQVLPRARAVENLCYVAAANGAAALAGESLVGRSAVYDPWGTPVARAGPDPEVLYARADPERVADVRESFPALADRRTRKP